MNYEYESAVQSADCSADCSTNCTADPDQTCTLQCIIQMGDLSKIIMIGVVMSRLVGMGLKAHTH